MGDAPAPVAGTDADAPHRPDGQVIDVGDLGRPRERQLRSGCDGGPPGDLGTGVGEDAGRDLAAAQHLDELAPGAADELAVGLPVQPVTEAPAHRRIGVLGPKHGRDVAEPCLRGGPDHDAHRARLRQAITSGAARRTRRPACQAARAPCAPKTELGASRIKIRWIRAAQPTGGTVARQRSGSPGASPRRGTLATSWRSCGRTSRRGGHGTSASCVTLRDRYPAPARRASPPIWAAEQWSLCALTFVQIGMI